MEFAAGLMLYFISYLGNYGLFYQGLWLAKHLRYDDFLIIVFSGFQLVYILLLFLDWYFSFYEINEKEIVRKSGLIWRRRRSVSLANVTSVELYLSPLSRVMHHATIIIDHANGRVTKLKNIGNFEEYLYMIKQCVRAASGKPHSEDVRLLVSQGEGMHVEFKETLRHDVRRGEVSREMERMVGKTIVAFLNAEGGTLVIGVNDAGETVGLENDYKTLPKKNRDGFENHIGMLVKTMIGLPFAKYVSAGFDLIDGKDVCIVTVGESHKPAYLRGSDKSEEFYVRVGNSTQPFSMSEAEEYIKTRWK
jgi:membrane protein YdbS with pleckstrin-like domain